MATKINAWYPDKIADFMKLAECYEATQNVDQADIILFNIIWYLNGHKKYSAS